MYDTWSKPDIYFSKWAHNFALHQLLYSLRKFGFFHLALSNNRYAKSRYMFCYAWICLNTVKYLFNVHQLNRNLTNEHFINENYLECGERRFEIKNIIACGWKNIGEKVTVEKSSINPVRIMPLYKSNPNENLCRSLADIKNGELFIHSICELNTYNYIQNSQLMMLHHPARWNFGVLYFVLCERSIDFEWMWNDLLIFVLFVIN